MGFLAGKRVLVTGLISNRSIAWGIAKAAQREGAELALTYQTDRFKDRVTDMGKELGTDIVLPCEVTEDASIASCATAPASGNARTCEKLKSVWFSRTRSV